MSLGSGGFSTNVWDGDESFDFNFDIDQKGKAAENQHAMLLRSHSFQVHIFNAG